MANPARAKSAARVTRPDATGAAAVDAEENVTGPIVVEIAAGIVVRLAGNPAGNLAAATMARAGGATDRVTTSRAVINRANWPPNRQAIPISPTSITSTLARSVRNPAKALPSATARGAMRLIAVVKRDAAGAVAAAVDAVAATVSTAQQRPPR